MSRTETLKRLSGLAAPSLLVVLLSAACAGPSRSGFADETTRDPASLIDGYLIARGMALSYGRSGRAGPAEIAQLVQYDHAALIAVASAELEPGDAHRDKAERALQALVTYTGDQDLQPGPTTMPAMP